MYTPPMSATSAASWNVRKRTSAFLVMMREPTLNMRREASSAGDYVSVVWDEKYPRIQLLTAEGLLAGKEVRYSRGDKLAVRMALDQEGHLSSWSLLSSGLAEPRPQASTSSAGTLPSSGPGLTSSFVRSALTWTQSMDQPGVAAPAA